MTSHSTVGVILPPTALDPSHTGHENWQSSTYPQASSFSLYSFSFSGWTKSLADMDKIAPKVSDDGFTGSNDGPKVSDDGPKVSDDG
jgi:hypothetical protein